MYSTTNGGGVNIRKTRKLSFRSQQLISDLYAESGESDSGLDSSGEENTQSR